MSSASRRRRLTESHHGEHPDPWSYSCKDPPNCSLVGSRPLTVVPLGEAMHNNRPGHARLHGSLADLFRQIGRDERTHKLDSLAKMRAFRPHRALA